MVYGMLGGSFCPPTIAHVELSNLCVEKGLCDKVIWVPVNEAYRKATNISAKHRINMVELAIKDEPNIDISLHEQDFDGIVRTIDSIKILQKNYPQDKLLFIAGADKLGFKWIQREEFVRDFGLIVVNRGDIDCEELINNSNNLSRWKQNIKILNYNSDISSTIVRDEIKNSKESSLIKKEVLDYILENNLFLR